MTAVELAALSDLSYEQRRVTFGMFSVKELKTIKRQAYEALRTVGDAPRFWQVNKMTGNAFNKLEMTAKLAGAYIDMKEGH